MTQPTALFLADVIDADAGSKAHHGSAAYELRRLHAEVERLRQIVEDFPPVEAELREVSDRAHRLHAQRDALLEACNNTFSCRCSKHFALQQPEQRPKRVLTAVWRDRAQRAEAQRDALLTALRAMRVKYGQYACRVCDLADAAIAKAEGENA